LAYTFKPILQDLHTDDSKIRFFNTGYTHCRTKIENFGVPRKLALGVAYHVNRKWLIGMDMEWQQYSRAFNEFIIKLTDMKISPNVSYVYCFEGKGINKVASFPAKNPAPEFSDSATYYKDMHFNICITYHFK